MKKVFLHSKHEQKGAKMIEFAGYQMPIQYKMGVIKEHEWVRHNCGIFDVSHMGQLVFSGENLDKFFSYITPSSFLNLENGQAKYTVLLNDKGGIIDDLIITKITEKRFFVVINAACIEKDIKWIDNQINKGNFNISYEIKKDSSLIAVQGPKAEKIIAEIFGNEISNINYMTVATIVYKNVDIFLSRTGYTGENGFEISANNVVAGEIWDRLVAFEEVEPIGLGARDSLRLEVGYPLYGNDMNEEISPVQAALSWIISKDNQDFVGKKRIDDEKTLGISKKRVGIQLLDKGILRATMQIFDQEQKKEIGVVTSGGYSPLLKTSIAQGYVDRDYMKKGTKICLKVRDRLLNGEVRSFIFYKKT